MPNETRTEREYAALRLSPEKVVLYASMQTETPEVDEELPRLILCSADDIQNNLPDAVGGILINSDVPDSESFRIGRVRTRSGLQPAICKVYTQEVLDERLSVMLKPPDGSVPLLTDEMSKVMAQVLRDLTAAAGPQDSRSDQEQQKEPAIRPPLEIGKQRPVKALRGYQNVVIVGVDEADLAYLGPHIARIYRGGAEKFPDSAKIPFDAAVIGINTKAVDEENTQRLIRIGYARGLPIYDSTDPVILRSDLIVLLAGLKDFLSKSATLNGTPNTQKTSGHEVKLMSLQASETSPGTSKSDPAEVPSGSDTGSPRKPEDWIKPRVLAIGLTLEDQRLMEAEWGTLVTVCDKLPNDDIPNAKALSASFTCAVVSRESPQFTNANSCLRAAKQRPSPIRIHMVRDAKECMKTADHLLRTETTEAERQQALQDFRSKKDAERMAAAAEAEKERQKKLAATAGTEKDTEPLACEKIADSARSVSTRPTRAMSLRDAVALYPDVDPQAQPLEYWGKFLGQKFKEDGIVSTQGKVWTNDQLLEGLRQLYRLPRNERGASLLAFEPRGKSSVTPTASATETEEDNATTVVVVEAGPGPVAQVAAEKIVSTQALVQDLEDTTTSSDAQNQQSSVTVVAVEAESVGIASASEVAVGSEVVVEAAASPVLSDTPESAALNEKTRKFRRPNRALGEKSSTEWVNQFGFDRSLPRRQEAVRLQKLISEQPPQQIFGVESLITLLGSLATEERKEKECQSSPPQPAASSQSAAETGTPDEPASAVTTQQATELAEPVEMSADVVASDAGVTEAETPVSEPVVETSESTTEEAELAADTRTEFERGELKKLIIALLPTMDQTILQKPGLTRIVRRQLRTGTGLAPNLETVRKIIAVLKEERADLFPTPEPSDPTRDEEGELQQRQYKPGELKREVRALLLTPEAAQLPTKFIARSRAIAQIVQKKTRVQTDWDHVRKILKQLEREPGETGDLTIIIQELKRKEEVRHEQRMDEINILFEANALNAKRAVEIAELKEALATKEEELRQAKESLKHKDTGKEQELKQVKKDLANAQETLDLFRRKLGVPTASSGPDSSQ